MTIKNFQRVNRFFKEKFISISSQLKHFLFAITHKCAVLNSEPKVKYINVNKIV